MSDQVNQGFGFDDDIFSGGGGTTVPYHKFKNGEHKFRPAPPFAPKKLFHQEDLHWGYADENGRPVPIVCTKFKNEFNRRCAICDELDRLAKLKTTYEQANRIAEMKQIEKTISDFRRKSTYLWNIKLEDGEEKVLQLSWNGHEPLLKKIEFYWKQKQVNVTDPSKNYMIWVSRTGEKAKTRYQYEVLEQTVSAVEFKKLFDLTKIYAPRPYDEVAKVVAAGRVKAEGKKHEEKDFLAELPPASAPTSHQAEAPKAPEPVANKEPAPAPAQPKVNVDASQQKEIDSMLATLNGMK